MILLRKERINRYVIFLFVLLIVVLPKAGIKLTGIPITWGYLYVGLVTVFQFFVIIYFKKMIISTKNFIVYCSTLPFQIYSGLLLLFNGIENVGFTISFVISFMFFPFVFLILLNSYFRKIDFEFVVDILKGAVFFVSIYGLFLFFLKFMFDYSLEIPYITVNAGDVGKASEKFNDRGGIFKLISTYGNGNIYGASMLMLLPLYCLTEKNMIKKFLVKSSLILTLSRTVWIGLIFFEIIINLSLNKLDVKKIFQVFTGVVFLLVLLYIVMVNILGRDAGFLFNKNLGGRLSQFDVLFDLKLIPIYVFNGISEIVYLSILKNFGVIGLFLYLIAVLSPLLVYKFMQAKNNDYDNYKKRIYQGLLIYLIISFSDGAVLFIPVMAFFWILASLLLTNTKQRIGPEGVVDL